MKKIAIVISGCGVYDGAEIHEATMTMLSASQQELDYQIFAPDIEQEHVINHFTGKEMKESRNVLVESARIARGNIFPLDTLNTSEFAAIIFPGGFGVAKNLCTYATEGVNCSVDSEVERIIHEFHKQKKPIGALCISPVLITKVLKNIKVTIGNDVPTLEAIEKLGGEHTTTNHGEVAIDKENLIFTTPCYMLDSTITQIYNGAYNVVKEIKKHI